MAGMKSPLHGKTVVVVGASAGIGREVARQAAQRGAKVTMTARGSERLNAAAQTIDGDVTAELLDGLDRDAVQAFFSRMGKIDHFVSLIGDTENGSFLEVDEKRAREVIERKVWAQLFLVKTVKDKVVPDGSITLTGGTADKRGIFAFGFAYSILGNKALELLVDGLAVELSPVRVNVVAPGLTDTSLHDGMDPEVRKQVYARYKEMLLVQRIPTADEVARTYIHAMESGLINGECLRPDGGRALGEF